MLYEKHYFCNSYYATKQWTQKLFWNISFMTKSHCSHPMCTNHGNHRINHLSIQRRKWLSHDQHPGYHWDVANKPRPPLTTLMSRWRHFAPHLNMDKWHHCWFLNFADEAWKTRTSCSSSFLYRIGQSRLHTSSYAFSKFWCHTAFPSWVSRSVIDFENRQSISS